MLRGKVQLLAAQVVVLLVMEADLEVEEVHVNLVAEEVRVVTLALVVLEVYMQVELMEALVQAVVQAVVALRVVQALAPDKLEMLAVAVE